jgi:hypothetical protein
MTAAKPEAMWWTVVENAAVNYPGDQHIHGEMAILQEGRVGLAISGLPIPEKTLRTQYGVPT